jgi:hypothetical protein
MTLAIHYTYISGNPAAIEQAWTNFERAQDLTAAPDRGVYFIPATGGCFVVLQDLEPSALAPLAWLIPSKKDVIGEALQRFKLSFEGTP